MARHEIGGILRLDCVASFAGDDRRIGKTKEKKNKKKKQ
jgi:hypothetical protein